MRLFIKTSYNASKALKRPENPPPETYNSLILNVLFLGIRTTVRLKSDSATSIVWHVAANTRSLLCRGLGICESNAGAA